MTVEIRPADDTDFRRLAGIAAEGDSDAAPDYLEFVAAEGRVVVAADGGLVVGFAGMIPVRHHPAPPIAMVTDLFVSAGARGRGIGGALLDRLLVGWSPRMTSSSKHPAALPAYRRVGLEPRWELEYLSGRALGGGPPLRSEPWAHDRAELVEYFAHGGAVVTADAVVDVRADGAEVLRVHSDDPIAAVSRVLAALPEGLPVRLCAPRPRAVAAWLREVGFTAIDHDIWCTTDGVDLPIAVSCVHAGLA